jgi:hypothetical protein
MGAAGDRWDSDAPDSNSSIEEGKSEGIDEDSLSEAEGHGSSDDSVSSGGLTNTSEDSDG